MHTHIPGISDLLLLQPIVEPQNTTHTPSVRTFLFLLRLITKQTFGLASISSMVMLAAFGSLAAAMLAQTMCVEHN